MTAPARITQADMERAAKCIKAAGFERARIVMRFQKGEIEVIIGESANHQDDAEDWSDDET